MSVTTRSTTRHCNTSRASSVSAAVVTCRFASAARSQHKSRIILSSSTIKTDGTGGVPSEVAGAQCACIEMPFLSTQGKKNNSLLVSGLSTIYLLHTARGMYYKYSYL